MSSIPMPVIWRLLKPRERQTLLAYRCTNRTRTPKHADEALCRRLARHGLRTLAEAAERPASDFQRPGVEIDTAALRDLIERALKPGILTWITPVRHSVPDAVSTRLAARPLRLAGLPIRAATILKHEGCRTIADIAAMNLHDLRAICDDVDWLYEIRSTIRMAHREAYAYRVDSRRLWAQHLQYGVWFTKMPGVFPDLIGSTDLPETACRKQDVPITTVPDLIARHILRDLTDLAAIDAQTRECTSAAEPAEDRPVTASQILACSQWLAMRLARRRCTVDSYCGYPVWIRPSAAPITEDRALHAILKTLQSSDASCTMSHASPADAALDLRADTRPEIRDAVEAAHAHAAAHYAAQPGTLIDQITDEDLAAWDGRDERAIVGTLRAN